ncbi:GDSL esterase/lipase At3g62280-like [Ananas comosus]|uniref:GDSL esterase/lipase At3g62280-like n=1 Tax=Ananas comosus TaxID=4615 RepID=A0A6P5EU75_ANACO|nr:GDSL esterase/lipase At3g62280-like [Ananas comosus]
MGNSRAGYSLPSFNNLFVVVILVLYPLPTHVDSKCIIFNFGDSNSDTGALTSGLGLYLGPPAGRQFFHKTTGRFCDGRLYIDFICENLKINYLSPYLESLGSNFTHGVNFAVAGAATQMTGVPFPLSTQVLQFLHFKNRTRDLRSKGLGSLISEKEFHDAVYSFDMGQNDISIAFIANLSYPRVVDNIPSILSRIEDAIELVYENGGRKFWIYNTGPLGCLPQTLALRKKNDSELDLLGCLADYNNAAKAFNEQMNKLCDKLSSEYKNATTVCTDMYSIKYDLFANHKEYGFENPLMACCGHGGPPYNYADRITCGQPTATACAVGDRSISWDGVHYTEVANKIAASKILSGKYSNPQIKLTTLCRS